jgi:tRNA dimethylallyltransferase
MEHRQKTVIIIGGPTAVGKTAVAVQLARELGTEIISADSRQCYRELNIGVARPSDEELAAVPHHFIASHSIHAKVDAALFETYALRKAAEVFSSRDTVVMVGGTGLYIKAFRDGLDAIPEVPGSVRAAIISQYEEKGITWLQEEVKQRDPAFFAAGEINNPHRMMRALEVVMTTGKSILHFRKGKKAERDFEILQIAIGLPREELHRNINARVNRMMEEGLLEEARGLQLWQSNNALQTVGYRELFEYFDGRWSLDEAAERIRIHTRQYAKRQLTWFRKDPGWQWLPPDLQAVSGFVAKSGVRKP